MNKLVKRLLTGTLAFATILTALPVTAVHASGNQYWTESAERVGYIEHVMNDGSIKSTFNEGHMKVDGETAYCVDINTSFKNGYKTRSDASTRMSSDQIADVALSLEYVKQYTAFISSVTATLPDSIPVICHWHESCYLSFSTSYANTSYFFGGCCGALFCGFPA